MSLADFHQFCDGVRARGFDTVRTPKNQYPLEIWATDGPFVGSEFKFDRTLGGFVWIGPDEVRDIPARAPHPDSYAVWRFSISARYAFTSAPLLIEQTQWRLVVLQDRRQREFEWRRPGETEWHPARTWPSYSLIRRYAGLPSSLNRLEFLNAARLKRVVLEHVLTPANVTGANGTFIELRPAPFPPDANPPWM